MHAKVTIIREEGQLRVPIGTGRRLEGDLSLRHEPLPGEERTVPVLRVLGAHSNRLLFDPKVVNIIAGTIVFAGLERVERAWYAQEWSCEVF